jgi:hypothetical protein
LSPGQEQANVAGHSAGKIESPGGKPKTVRIQVTLPPEIDFRRLAAKSRRPIGFGRIDGPAAIAAQLAWEAQHHEFLFPVLCRPARFVHQDTPAFVGDVIVNQLCYSAPAPFRPGAAVFLTMLHFLLFVRAIAEFW